MFTNINANWLEKAFGSVLVAITQLALLAFPHKLSPAWRLRSIQTSLLKSSFSQQSLLGHCTPHGSCYNGWSWHEVGSCSCSLHVPPCPVLSLCSCSCSFYAPPCRTVRWCGGIKWHAVGRSRMASRPRVQIVPLARYFVVCNAVARYRSFRMRAWLLGLLATDE